VFESLEMIVYWLSIVGFTVQILASVWLAAFLFVTADKPSTLTVAACLFIFATAGACELYERLHE
jgi:hypothetical protein